MIDFLIYFQYQKIFLEKWPKIVLFQEYFCNGCFIAQCWVENGEPIDGSKDGTSRSSRQQLPTGLRQAGAGPGEGGRGQGWGQDWDARRPLRGQLRVQREQYAGGGEGSRTPSQLRSSQLRSSVHLLRVLRWTRLQHYPHNHQGSPAHGDGGRKLPPCSEYTRILLQFISVPWSPYLHISYLPRCWYNLSCISGNAALHIVFELVTEKDCFYRQR